MTITPLAIAFNSILRLKLSNIEGFMNHVDFVKYKIKNTV